MRGIFVIAIGLVVAYWVDYQYYGGMYGRETGDIVRHISASFRH